MTLFTNTGCCFAFSLICFFSFTLFFLHGPFLLLLCCLFMCPFLSFYGSGLSRILRKPPFESGIFGGIFPLLFHQIPHLVVLDIILFFFFFFLKFLPTWRLFLVSKQMAPFKLSNDGFNWEVWKQFCLVQFTMLI